jgi:pilus assembly protein FimV
MAFKRWQTFAGVMLIVAATAASALSLGRVRGTALVGRGLDLSVQANLEAQEATPEANCFAVELFYGETRVSPNAVSVSPERSAGGELRIRVRASTVVDEPVVTLFLRAACGAAVSRRYVLLAETLSETETGGASPVVINPSVPSLAPLATPRQGFGGVQSPAQTVGSAAERRAERAATRQAQREARQLAAAERASSQPARDVRVITPELAAPRASIVRKTPPAQPVGFIGYLRRRAQPTRFSGAEQYTFR